MLVFLDYSGLPVVHDLAKWSDKLYYLVRCKNEYRNHGYVLRPYNNTYPQQELIYICDQHTNNR